MRRILLVSSSGGVLPDLLALEPWWGRYDARWVAESFGSRAATVARLLSP